MVVSDTTTLIILSDLERFELLSNLFSHIIIPQAVHHELNAKTQTTLPPFITIQKCTQEKSIQALTQLLDRGESEAITLAVELGTGLIIDEKKGRKIAMNKGVKIIGLLGIITLNIQRGHITKSQAHAFLEDALTHGYRINTALIEEMFSRWEK